MLSMPSSACSTSSCRYTGNRATVASGIRRVRWGDIENEPRPACAHVHKHGQGRAPNVESTDVFLPPTKRLVPGPDRLSGDDRAVELSADDLAGGVARELIDEDHLR